MVPVCNERHDIFEELIMAKVFRSHPRSFGALGALVLIALLAFFTFSTSADGKADLVGNSGVFVGTDDTGNFQGALDDAVTKAAAAAGCCDIRISYKVVETTGRHGGFLFVDEVSVKIAAEW